MAEMSCNQLLIDIAMLMINLPTREKLTASHTLKISECPQSTAATVTAMLTVIT